MEKGDGYQTQDFRNNITLLPTFRRVLTHKSEKQRQMPQISDIRIRFSHVSPNHFSIFFILGVENLFQTRDCVLKVENFGARSRLIS